MCKRLRAFQQNQNEMDPLQKHAIRILEFLNKGHFVAARIYLIKHLKQSTASGGGTNHNAHLASFLNCLIELINNSSAAGPAVSADQTPVFPHISLLSVAAPSNSPQDQESLARISVLLDELYKRRIMDYLALVRLCYTCIKAERYIVLLYVDRVSVCDALSTLALHLKQPSNNIVLI